MKLMIRLETFTLTADGKSVVTGWMVSQEKDGAEPRMVGVEGREYKTPDELLAASTAAAADLITQALLGGQ